MLLNVVPPSVDTCHCTEGAGLPEAAAVKLAVVPAQTVVFDGFVVTLGGVVTVSVAAVDVAVPQTLVKTARYWCPSSVGAVVNEYVVEVAPPMLLNVTPPSVETCHCTVGLGLPEAAAVKLALVPVQVVTFEGLVVTAGAVLTVRVAAVEVALEQVFVNTARYWLLLSVDWAVNE